MTPIAMLLQAVEALPEESAATADAAATVADAFPVAGGNSLDVVQLLLHASIPVQLVMLLLLFASVASWVII